MDMVMGIALTGLAMHISHMITDVDMALMSKALDLIEAQGEAVQEAMELSSPNFHVLDVCAQGTAL